MAGQSRVVDFDDTAFNQGIQDHMRKLKIKSERELAALATDVANRAKQLSPVDTGRLRSSIHTQGGKDALGPFQDVGTNVQYAPFIEFGTRHSAAQPYLRPALLEAVTKWSSRKWSY